jgi:hypothetical protein
MLYPPELRARFSYDSNSMQPSLASGRANNLLNTFLL